MIKWVLAQPHSYYVFYAIVVMFSAEWCKLFVEMFGVFQGHGQTRLFIYVIGFVAGLFFSVFIYTKCEYTKLAAVFLLTNVLYDFLNYLIYPILRKYTKYYREQINI